MCEGKKGHVPADLDITTEHPAIYVDKVKPTITLEATGLGLHPKDVFPINWALLDVHHDACQATDPSQMAFPLS